jgi:fatty-acyl-CoA synthase
MRIVGRIKELIITGGNNVYPAEVEALLERHPAVKGAQVVGVPDKLKGEVIMAYIVPKASTKCTQEEIQVFCKERTSNYKIPQFVRFVEGFPISAAGKVLK